MPYIEKLGNKKINEQLHQWYHVMVDPRIDGFNGWGCKKKLYKVKFELEKILNNPNCPTYSGEEEWLEEQRFDKAVDKIKGNNDGIPYVP